MPQSVSSLGAGKLRFADRSSPDMVQGAECGRGGLPSVVPTRSWLLRPRAGLVLVALDPVSPPAARKKVRAGLATTGPRSRLGRR